MTPTQSFVAAAQRSWDVRDALGRVLTVHHISALDRLKLFKAVPPYLAQNDLYLGQACLAFAVSAIDGVPFPQPTNEPQIDSAIERLGNEGIDAIGEALKPEELAGATAGN
jgi:hypothetical protein